VEIKKKREILRRLKIVGGHIRKVIEMVEKDKYCIDVLQQSLAVQNALKRVDELILDSHLHSCIIRAFQKKGKREKAIRELLSILKKARR
jgi:DNA-binding FrmR family transcriptional regulator